MAPPHISLNYTCALMAKNQGLGAGHFWSPAPKNWERSRSYGAGLRSGARAKRAKKIGAGSPQKEPSSQRKSQKSQEPKIGSQLPAPRARLQSQSRAGSPQKRAKLFSLFFCFFEISFLFRFRILFYEQVAPSDKKLQEE